MQKFLLLTTLIFSLTGCSLIPKRVEFFQDKVHKFPEPGAKQVELQREVAQRAKEKAQETLVAATREHSSPDVTSPAAETAVLTDAVSQSVGAPAKRPTADSSALADELRASIAKLDRKIDSFKRDNDENAGKKIEGTGLVQVSYFVYLGGIILVVLIGRVILKDILLAASAANPGAAVAVGGLNVAGSLLSRGFHQVIKGGKDFVTWVNNEIEDPGLRDKIVGAFVANQKTAQDRDVKSVVDHVLGK